MIPETPFINGVTLSYPIGVFPRLFKTVGANTKKGFVSAILKMEDENHGGEGIPTDVMINIIQVGLISKTPNASFEVAADLMQAFLITYGYKTLEKVVVDAWVDCGLYDRATVTKQREFTAKIEALQEEREAAMIEQSQLQLNRINSKISELIEAAVQQKILDKGELPKPFTEALERELEEEEYYPVYGVEEEEEEEEEEDEERGPERFVKSQLSAFDQVKEAHSKGGNKKPVVKPAPPPGTPIKGDRRNIHRRGRPLEPPELMRYQ